MFAKLPDIKLDPEKDFMVGENEPPYTRRHRKELFAAATIFQDTPEKRWELLRASGMRMCRYWLRWMLFEPEEGKISNFPHDDDIAIMKRAGIEPVVMLGDSSISTKKGHENENWFIIKRSQQGKRTYLSSGTVRNFTRMEDWKKHVRDVVSRYKGTVRYFEIMNEPNLFFEPAEYVPYLKAAYETAKEVNPDCVIVGICATGDFAGKKCLGPWVPLAGCNGALYENADGSQTAAIWAVEEDTIFRFSAESGVKAYDMFGNEIAATGTLTAKPVWFTGQNLKKNLALSPAETFAVRGIRAVGGDKMQLAVDVLNRRAETQTAQVKPRGVKGKQSAVIPAGAAHTFFFPVTEFKKECAVIVSNEEKMQSVTLPVIPARKALKSGTEQVMPYGAFRVTTLPEGLDFRIKVRDDKRGDYEAKTPWEGDGVELFIDSRPFTGLDKGIYNNHVFRVFANPATKSHKASLSTSPNLDSSVIRWNIKENGADYEVSILIPWKSLKINAPATLAFDIAVNDSDDNTRLSTIPWSGDSDNYRNRFNFGTLIIK